MRIPLYIEVEPDSFKVAFDCTFDEILAGRKIEQIVSRRRMLDALVRAMRPKWATRPSAPLRDLLAE